MKKSKLVIHPTQKQAQSQPLSSTMKKRLQSMLGNNFSPTQLKPQFFLSHNYTDEQKFLIKQQKIYDHLETKDLKKFGHFVRSVDKIKPLPPSQNSDRSQLIALFDKLNSQDKSHLSKKQSVEELVKANELRSIIDRARKILKLYKERLKTTEIEKQVLVQEVQYWKSKYNQSKKTLS
ncbi:hypothetical protein pb186bvf_014831 [Paramecium bursaria]